MGIRYMITAVAVLSIILTVVLLLLSYQPSQEEAYAQTQTQGTITYVAEEEDIQDDLQVAERMIKSFQITE
jgi:hypothetical protein